MPAFNGKMDLDRERGDAEKLHFVVSWRDQQCSACMNRNLSMDMFFFVGVCCELVHGDCFVVEFGLCVSAAIFPNDDIARSDSRVRRSPNGSRLNV